MCTSFIYNGKKTLVGWNLDILDMEYKVVREPDKVYIAINDKEDGWLPLFGVNNRGDFVAMPTCHPFDDRSNPTSETDVDVIHLDIDLLLGKRTFEETVRFVNEHRICSVPGVTFMAQLSDKNGNVLQVIPGQGSNYIEKPDYVVLSNFSPFKGDSEKHPWMGLDRYETATAMLKKAGKDLTVPMGFDILKAVSQTVCPTVVSMVYDSEENTMYWCEQRDYENIQSSRMKRG